MVEISNLENENSVGSDDEGVVIDELGIKRLKKGHMRTHLKNGLNKILEVIVKNYDNKTSKFFKSP